MPPKCRVRRRSKLVVCEGPPAGARVARCRADCREPRRGVAHDRCARSGHHRFGPAGLEGATLFLAAGAYLAYALAHHRNHRDLVTRSILVGAFALWGIVQLAPGFADVDLLNDVAIVLFVADLAFLLSPWT